MYVIVWLKMFQCNNENMSDKWIVMGSLCDLWWKQCYTYVNLLEYLYMCSLSFRCFKFCWIILECEDENSG